MCNSKHSGKRKEKEKEEKEKEKRQKNKNKLQKTTKKDINYNQVTIKVNVQLSRRYKQTVLIDKETDKVKGLQVSDITKLTSTNSCGKKRNQTCRNGEIVSLFSLSLSLLGVSAYTCITVRERESE